MAKQYQLKKRYYSDGTIRIRNGRYYISWHDKETNKTKYKTLKLGTTPREADDILDSFIHQTKNGTYIPTVKATVNEAMENMLLYRKQVMEIKDSSLQNYRDIHKTHIEPTIGKMRIQDIKPADIEKWFISLKSLAINQKRYTYALLKRVFVKAVEDQTILKNPCNLELPEETTPDIEVLTDEEVQRLLEYLDKSKTTYRLPILISLFTGLRRGEVLALKWENIDFQQGKLSVVSNLVKIGAEYHLTTPKTKNSNRTIVISDDLVSILLEAKANQETHTQVSGLRNIDGFVCCNEAYEFLKPANFTHAFQDIMKTAKITKSHITVHGLRHTHLTLCCRTMGSKEVAERAGHNKVEFTLNKYVHKSEELERQGMKQFDNIIRGNF
jgi:integrase